MNAPLRMSARNDDPPLIVHVIHHLVIGGLENGLVNLINHMPPERYRHAIVCMVDFSDFSRRIRREGVPVYAMHKKVGRDITVYPKLYSLFRRLKPQLVHTRNLTALDSLLPAMLAGVPCRVHGEHGWNVTDPEGRHTKYRWLRRLHRPMVNHYVAVSRDLEKYLRDGVGVPGNRTTQIYNGVDTSLFHPVSEGREAIGPFSDPRYFVVGTVGRMQAVKDPLTLIRAMVALWKRDREAYARVRLVVVGDGPLREAAESLLAHEGMRRLAWFAGARDDVPRVMRGLDLFVLPSVAEGISNTILEAMATGLPVVATAVGGNPELVVDASTGTLVPAADIQSMTAAIAHYVDHPWIARAHGTAARERAEDCFGLDVMVHRYMDLYDRMLGIHSSSSYRPRPAQTGRSVNAGIP